MQCWTCAFSPTSSTTCPSLDAKPLGRLLALGISTNFFMYAFVNLAMVTGAIPVGGVPLPLVSHGGSAMLMAMFGFGLLMSVHVHRDAEFCERWDD